MNSYKVQMNYELVRLFFEELVSKLIFFFSHARVYICTTFLSAHRVQPCAQVALRVAMSSKCLRLHRDSVPWSLVEHLLQHRHLDLQREQTSLTGAVNVYKGRAWSTPVRSAPSCNCFKKMLDLLEMLLGDASRHDVSASTPRNCLYDCPASTEYLHAPLRKERWHSCGRPTGRLNHFEEREDVTLTVAFDIFQCIDVRMTNFVVTEDEHVPLLSPTEDKVFGMRPTRRPMTKNVKKENVHRKFDGVASSTVFPNWCVCLKCTVSSRLSRASYTKKSWRNSQSSCLCQMFRSQTRVGSKSAEALFSCNLLLMICSTLATVVHRFVQYNTTSDDLSRTHT